MAEWGQSTKSDKVSSFVDCPLLPLPLCPHSSRSLHGLKEVFDLEECSINIDLGDAFDLLFKVFGLAADSRGVVTVNEAVTSIIAENFLEPDFNRIEIEIRYDEVACDGLHSWVWGLDFGQKVLIEGVDGEPILFRLIKRYECNAIEVIHGKKHSGIHRNALTGSSLPRLG